MVATNQAIDYEALLACLVHEVSATTGIPESSVYADQPAVAFAEQPPQPLMTIHVASSGRYGYDWGEDTDTLQGPRNIQVSFNCFAEDRMQAADIMETWAACLFAQEVREALLNIGIAVWSADQVLDMTEKYDTGFQPRTYMQATFGATSIIESSTGHIASAEITGLARSTVVAGDVTPTATTSGSAPVTFIGTAAQTGTVSTGNIVKATGAGLILADATNRVSVPCIGIATGVDSAGNVTVQTQGITPMGTFSNLVVGTTYFLGANGSLMPPPLNSMVYVQALGVAVSPSQLALQIVLTPTVRLLS